MLQLMRRGKTFWRGVRWKTTLLLLLSATTRLCGICVTLICAILCLCYSEKSLRMSISFRCTTPHKFANQLVLGQVISAVYAAAAYYIIIYLAWENKTFGVVDKFVSFILKSIAWTLNGCEMISMKSVLSSSQTYIPWNTYSKITKEKWEFDDSITTFTDSKTESYKSLSFDVSWTHEHAESKKNAISKLFTSILVLLFKLVNRCSRILTCKRHYNVCMELAANKHISKCMRLCKWLFNIAKYVITAFFKYWGTHIIIMLIVISILSLACMPKPQFDFDWDKMINERIMYFCRISADVFVFTASLIYIAVININKIWKELSKSPEHKIWRQGFMYMVLCIFISMILYVVHITTPYLQALQTEYELQRSILGEPINPCAAEGREENSSLRSSWVWPALLPKWLATVRHQNEHCHGANWHTLGFIDDSEMHIDTPLLIIPTMCPDHSTPRVFVERPSQTAGNLTYISSQDEILNFGVYYAELEALFGSEEKAKSKKLIVHRTEESKLITEVEVDISQYITHERKAISNEEKQIRRYWPTSKVYEIPLGYSAAYLLSCSQAQHEEVFMFPPILHMAMEPSLEHHSYLSSSDQSVDSAKETNTSQEPAGNVFILLFDALSRQAAARSLPHFSEWVQKFRARQEKLNESNKGSAKKEGYVVLESLAHTISGWNTVVNFVPYIAGITWFDANANKTKDFEWNAMNRSVFAIAKETHGDVINTAFTEKYCGNFFEMKFGDKSNSSGRGTSTNKVDYHFWEPMCHKDYSWKESAYRDRTSHCTRCIANKNVHQHLFDYTTHLLRRQLSNRNRITQNKFNLKNVNNVNFTHVVNESNHGNGEFFFDLTHFLEAHESTNSIIKQVDDDLVAFMEHLDEDLHYFDDPLNSFIFLADHGMHYGYYHHETQAGKFEHSTPAALYVIHPEVFRRIDANKQQRAGVSETNFRNRLKRVYSSLDVYLTLADLLNINATVFERYNSLKQTPNSLFNAHNSFYATQCDDFTTKETLAYCLLDFCK